MTFFQKQKSYQTQTFDSSVCEFATEGNIDV